MSILNPSSSSPFWLGLSIDSLGFLNLYTIRSQRLHPHQPDVQEKEFLIQVLKKIIQKSSFEILSLDLISLFEISFPFPYPEAPSQRHWIPTTCWGSGLFLPRSKIACEKTIMKDLFQLISTLRSLPFNLYPPTKLFLDYMSSFLIRLHKKRDEHQLIAIQTLDIQHIETHLFKKTAPWNTSYKDKPKQYTHPEYLLYYDLSPEEITQTLAALSFLPHSLEKTDLTPIHRQKQTPHLYDALKNQTLLTPAHYLAFIKWTRSPLAFDELQDEVQQNILEKPYARRPLTEFLFSLYDVTLNSHLIDINLTPLKTQKTKISFTSHISTQKRKHKNHSNYSTESNGEIFSLEHFLKKWDNPQLTSLDGGSSWGPLNIERVLHIFSIVYRIPDLLANLSFQRTGSFEFNDLQIYQFKKHIHASQFVQNKTNKKNFLNTENKEIPIPLPNTFHELELFAQFVLNTTFFNEKNPEKKNKLLSVQYKIQDLPTDIRVQVNWTPISTNPTETLIQILKDGIKNKEFDSLDKLHNTLKNFFKNLTYEPCIKILVDDRVYTYEQFQKMQHKTDGSWAFPDDFRLSPNQYHDIQDQIKNLTQHNQLTTPIHLNELWLSHRKLVGGKTPSKFEIYAQKIDVQLQHMQIFHNREILNLVQEILTPHIQKRLNTFLRSYQMYGVAWLFTQASFGLGTCIADDMGLGKTLQVLTHLSLLASETRTFLIIVPKSLVLNWTREIEKYVPWLKYQLWLSEHDHFNPTTPLTITTYPRIRLSYHKITEIQWEGVILDEAHTIKNHDTQISKSIRALKAHIRIAITGTPIENRSHELWTLCNWLNPNWLGNAKEFNQYTNLARNSNDKEKLLNPIRELLKPIILRRTKNEPEIAESLPDKVVELHVCQASPLQNLLYKNVLEDVLRRWEQADGMSIRRALFLKAILNFKQICNHPYVFMESLKKDHDQYHTFLSQLPPDIQDELLSSSESLQDMISKSGKLRLMIDLFEDFIASSRGILIFTQFHTAARLILDTLRKIYPIYHEAADFIHGSLDINHRMEIIDHFMKLTTQKEREVPPVLILSLKVGGTGLNLAGADTIIHFDRWWNPAVEDQATDRAHRIGQSSTVFVHSLTTADSIEESLSHLINQKRSLAKDLLADPNNDMLSIAIKSKSSFLELVDPQRKFFQMILDPSKISLLNSK